MGGLFQLDGTKGLHPECIQDLLARAEGRSHLEVDLILAHTSLTIKAMHVSQGRPWVSSDGDGCRVLLPWLRIMSKGAPLSTASLSRGSD